MTVYLFLFIVVLAGVAICRPQWSKSFNWYYIAELIIMICIVGFRYRIGGDSIRYEDGYDSIPEIQELFKNKYWWLDFEYQPLWIIFASICKTITPNFIFLQVIQATFVNCVFFYYAHKMCRYKFGFVILYFFYNYIYFSCEILRESIAVAIFIIGFKYLVSKSYIKYYFVCIMAFLFHMSAVILFIFPLIYNKLSNQYGWKSYIISILGGLVFSLVIQIILPKIGSLFLSSEYLLYKVQYAMNEENLNIFGVISQFFFMIPLILTGMYVDKGVTKEICKEKNFIIACLIIIATLSIIFPFLGRWRNYFIIFYLYYLSDFLFSIKFKQIWRIGAVFSFFIFMIQNINFYKSYPNIAVGENNSIRKYKMYYPYHSILDKDIDSDREYIAKYEFLSI